MWFITHCSTEVRMQHLRELPDKPSFMTPAALEILKREEKSTQRDDNPCSIATTMPRRILCMWGLNGASRLSKHATITTTVDMLQDFNPTILQDIHNLSNKRRMRESMTSATSKRQPLGTLTNLISNSTPSSPTNPPLKRKATSPPRTSPQPPIARQLFPAHKDNPFELSSDDDEPLHPTAQALRNINF